jgi:spermidine synthase
MALLKQLNTPYGKIRITRDRDGTMAYFQNGCFHSQADSRGVSVCAYVHLIYQLLCQKKARYVLIVGCGGGTLATMLVRAHIQVTIVDINPAAFTIARDYFKMPNEVICVEHNGLTYLRTTQQRFDAVVIDVFDNNNTIPDGFTTKKFLASVKKKLKRGGVLAMNVIIKNAKDVQAGNIAKNIIAAGMNAATYTWSTEKDSNTIIVGGSMKGVNIRSGKFSKSIKQEFKTLCVSTNR